MEPVVFIGAGPGDPELITVKGLNFLKRAEVVFYAGSLINRKVLEYCREDAELYDSQHLTLEEIVHIITAKAKAGKKVVRLHSGDPSIYGAIKEQIIALEAKGIPCEIVPGVSSFQAAAAALKLEYTVPEVSQTIILTRIAGRTPVPESEALDKLAAHGASMCLFLSTDYIEEVAERLKSGYPVDTPVAVVKKASWEDQEIIWGDLRNIAGKVKDKGIKSQALILVGPFLRESFTRSKLYHPDFSHGGRKQ